MFLSLLPPPFLSVFRESVNKKKFKKRESHYSPVIPGTIGYRSRPGAVSLQAVLISPQPQGQSVWGISNAHRLWRRKCPVPVQSQQTFLTHPSTHPTVCFCCVLHVCVHIKYGIPFACRIYNGVRYHMTKASKSKIAIFSASVHAFDPLLFAG